MPQRKNPSAKPNADTNGKPNALQQPLTPSKELAAVVGSSDPLPRGEAVKRVWDYIKANNLQDSKDRRQINGDDKLKAVMGGKAQVSMFEMNKHLAQHLK